MLAARDQENLVHGRQTAAASKPLNQGVRQLQPKTPGNKAPKTPFKIPLNDENANNGLGPVKGTAKATGAGKNAFVTPSGPKARAPLGAKTTNAKAKQVQTPALGGDGAATKVGKNKTSIQKPKLKLVETTKLEVTADQEEDVPDVEYMPPRSQNLPDIPDDWIELDYSMLDNITPLQAAFHKIENAIGLDGLTDRERRQKKEILSIKRMEAKDRLLLDSLPMPCAHSPECPTEVCKDTVQARKEAQEVYDRTMAILDAEAAPKKLGKSPGKAPPTIAQSRIAATAIAKPKTAIKTTDPIKKQTAMPVRPRLTFTLLAANKQPAPAKKTPTGLHNAAVAASRTTIGQAKGRRVSNNLKKQVTAQGSAPFVPYEERDTSISAPEYWRRYGAPPVDSNMWYDCWSCGFFRESGNDGLDEEELKEREERDRMLDENLRQDALDDFQLSLGD